MLGDEMLPQVGIKGLSGIRHLRGLADIRNQSVLAHGEIPVGAADCRKLKKQAMLYLRAFWHLHEVGHDVEERIETLRFVIEA